MTITYHAGRRIQGLDADRTAIQLPSGSVGGWVELGRTTLGSNGDNIDVSSLPDKRYYMVLANTTSSGLNRHGLRYNSDTGSNYAWRYSANGANGAVTSNGRIIIQADNTATDEFSVTYIANKSDKEKLSYSQDVKQIATGATTAPARMETVGKHAQTSNPISTITLFNSESGDYASGSECVVLGWDPDDTHTNNFWEELASVDLSGGASDTISSGTFTAKKYLWIQCFTGNTGGATRASLRVGNTTIDTGNNYAYRRSTNGAGDALFTSTNRIHASSGAVADTEFTNVFIINNASNEKLAITHDVRRSTAGAGNAPTRDETVGKWTNTSNQINIVEFFNDQAGDFGTNTILKVWGAD